MLTNVGLACTGRSLNERKAMLIDGPGSLVYEFGLKGLQRAPGAGVACNYPRGEGRGLDNGAGHGFFRADEADQRTQDFQRGVVPILPHGPELLGRGAPGLGDVWPCSGVIGELQVSPQPAEREVGAAR